MDDTQTKDPAAPSGARPETDIGPGVLPDVRHAFAITPCSGAGQGVEILSNGVRFGVYSRHAQRIHLALFRDPDGEPDAILPLPSCEGHVFQGFVPGLKAGWFYGFFAEGPFDPRHGHRFNPRKFLLDPYARALHGTFRNSDGVLGGHVPGAGQEADLFRDHRPSHAFMPKCLITADRFDWQGVRPPAVPRDRLSIYEVHPKGFTAHPSSGARHPGTFLGVIEKIPYLKSLGITAVEFLPVHAKCSEDALLERGLSNYWGYNTAGFFALEPGYGSGSHPGCEIEEFKRMVRELHRAGIEVILDVVYNHTAEGNELGPTLSLRGLDNSSYYSLNGPEDSPGRFYYNYTGCGNTLNFGSGPVLKLVLDSLRYFATEMRVDGFRFDLATVLGRQGGTAFSPDAPFFAAVAQDPVLSKVRLIAEAWDLETYGVGQFPDNWMEWNDNFRDTIRRWVRGDPGLIPALRDKLEGSPEMYASSGREPASSVNFVVCHDGFTLRDLVSYNRKHNLANGEDNRDGSYENRSWNCGAEGETEDPAVTGLRGRQSRNALLLNALARGIPMFLGGDEFRRTQAGNNNAYCQDNAISWFDWDKAAAEEGFRRFFTEALAWRNRIGLSHAWTSISDREWGRYWQGWGAAGKPWPEDKPPADRHTAFLLRTLAVKEAWPERPDPAEEGALFFLLLNTEDETKTYQLPPLPPPWRWERVADTSLPAPEDILAAGESAPLASPHHYEVTGKSSALLRSAAGPRT